MQTSTLKYRRLEPEEIQQAFPRRGQMDLTEYEGMLQGLAPGDALEVDLDGLTVRSMKRRLGQAAKRVGFSIKWRMYEDNGKLVFQLRPAVKSSNRPVNPNDGRRLRYQNNHETTALSDSTTDEVPPTRAPNVIDGSTSRRRRNRKKVAVLSQ